MHFIIIHGVSKKSKPEQKMEQPVGVQSHNENSIEIFSLFTVTGVYIKTIIGGGGEVHTHLLISCTVFFFKSIVLMNFTIDGGPWNKFP